jgi:hypothetical protein
MVSWKFWKKKEPETLGAGLGLDAGNLGLEQPRTETYNKLKGTEFDTSFEQPNLEPLRPSAQPMQQYSQNTDIQLVSAKLDTLKAMLDVISQRLTAIEKNVEDKEKKKLW